MHHHRFAELICQARPPRGSSPFYCPLSNIMDITKFVVSQREKALLIGDYGSYRKQLSRRLLIVRKKLNYTSSKGRKYAPRAPVTAEDVANNNEY